MEPPFLGLDEVLEIHRDQIERYGGRKGLRDLGLLQSAIGMAWAGAGGRYFHADPFEMAAAYLFHIVRDHPFVDGNKRVGAAAAELFIMLNDSVLDATDSEMEETTLAVARGEMDVEPLTIWFRQRLVRRD